MSALVVADAVELTLDGEVLVAPVSFALDAGRALAVRGPNGSGSLSECQDTQY